MKNLKTRSLQIYVRWIVVAVALGILIGCNDGETSNVTFSTNRMYEGRSVICDNATTNLQYSFTYTPGLLGGLASWEQKLVGVTTGNVRFVKTFRPGDEQVVGEGQTYRVNTTIPAKTAPLALEPQAIIVEPKVLGKSRLELVLKGTNGTTQTFTSPPINVMNCTEN